MYMALSSEIYLKGGRYMKTIKSNIMLLLLVAFISSACSTVNERHVAATEDLSGKGVLIVTSYDTKGDMKEGRPTSHQMLLALYDGDPDDNDSKLIEEGGGPVWRVDNLAPGKYCLRISGWKDGDGDTDNSKAKDLKFRIEKGKITEINLVITDYLKSTILVGGVVVGTAAVLSIAFSVLIVIALISAI